MLVKYLNVSIVQQNIRFQLLFWFAANHFPFLYVQEAHESETM